MCRLFGLSGAPERVSATFWLLDAEDSLALQSRAQPDGYGIGTFDEQGRPQVEKQPVAAYADRGFARAAHRLRSTTFIAHLRFASTGEPSDRNTHPFEQRGRLLAHNGVLEGLDELDRELGEHRALVRGETDSERFLALVTREAEARGGDVEAGLVAAARWVAAHLPVFALNVVLTTARELWALRYPETHELLVLERAPGGSDGPPRHLDGTSAAGLLRVRSSDLVGLPSVVVASEALDENPAWRLLAPGELLHVDAGLRVSSRVVLEEPPAHPLALSDLAPHAAVSQSLQGAPGPAGGAR
jgi:predicted glutamine amidotransferase